MWVTALVIGFAGSLHCIGMCSPLAMAVTSMNASAFRSRLIYNSGRVLTYGLMGAAVAGAGFLLPFDKFQNMISISLGIAMLAVGFGSLKSIRIPGLTQLMQRFITLLKGLFARHLKRKNMGTMALLGALNGLLPCGLTIVALTWCLTLQGPLDGFYFMLIFGAGTLPAMLGLTSAIPMIIKKYHWNLQKITSTMIILSGVVLIARVFIIHLPHTSPGAHSLADIILCR